VLPDMRKVGYASAKDIVPVARVGDLVCGFTSAPSLGINTIAELVAHAKKNPGKLAFGSAGPGTSTHMRIEALKAAAGIDILHVPYRGSADALNDLLAGNVQMMNEINVIPHVKAGKLRLLAVNYPTRHPDFPTVPTWPRRGSRASTCRYGMRSGRPPARRSRSSTRSTARSSSWRRRPRWSPRCRTST